MRVATTWAMSIFPLDDWNVKCERRINSEMNRRCTEKKIIIIISSFLRHIHSFSNGFLRNHRLYASLMRYEDEQKMTSKKKRRKKTRWTGIRNEFKRIKWGCAASTCHLMFFWWKRRWLDWLNHTRPSPFSWHQISKCSALCSRSHSFSFCLLVIYSMCHCCRRHCCCCCGRISSCSLLRKRISEYIFIFTRHGDGRGMLLLLCKSRSKERRMFMLFTFVFTFMFIAFHFIWDEILFHIFLPMADASVKVARLLLIKFVNTVEISSPSFLIRSLCLFGTCPFSSRMHPEMFLWLTARTNVFLFNFDENVMTNGFAIGYRQSLR